MAKTAKTTETPEASTFDKFRDRAIALRGEASEVRVTNEPFILGKDDGFDVEIVLDKPKFTTRVAIEAALKDHDEVRIIQIMFGKYIDHVLRALEKYEEETGNAAIDVLAGLMAAYFEHFYGPNGVPEAFTAASA